MSPHDGLEKFRITVDLHVHTVASGHAYSTVEEIAAQASKKGLEAIAITDHGPALPGAAHLFHFWNLRVIPRRIAGVFILRSAEANIVDEDGTLDLDDELLRKLDVVHAGLHPLCGYTGENVEQNTRALLGAIRHPLTDIIVHPGNPSYPIDVEEVVRVAKEYGKALEINNSSFVYTRMGSRENCLVIARKVKETDGLIAVGSDAHFSSFAGEFSRAVEIIAEAGIEEDKIVNLNLERLREFLAGRGKTLQLQDDEV